MSLLSVTSDALPNTAQILAALDGLAPKAPIVILTHGYRFAPGAGVDDPARHILSLAPDVGCWKAVSWPGQLGLGGSAGLAVGFGWPAKGSIWQAYAQAARAGRQMARLIAKLHRIAPHRPIHLVGHSLGGRVVMTALGRCKPGLVRRVLLLAPAVGLVEANAALSSPAGRQADVVLSIGRENLLFDTLLRLALPGLGPTIAYGLPEGPGRLTLRLDRAETRDGLARIGHSIGKARSPVCHWSVYLRDGVWDLYRDLILHPDETPLAWLGRAIAPAGPGHSAPRSGAIWASSFMRRA